VKIRSRVFTGEYTLVDESNGAAVVPSKPESDVIEFRAEAGRTYRATSLGAAPLVQPGVNYRLVAQHSGKAADINGASTAAGATLIQWAVNSGSNQQFDFVDAGGGYWRIRARHSGLVLQVASTATGADITQQPASTATSQQWQVVDQGGGTASLVNRASGLAMDVWSASTADGARISQWNRTGAANQRFELRRA
jgi:alpha-L-fucosidase 2